MRRVIFSLTTAVALSSFAMAGGDIVPVAPAPADSWSGFYVGLQAGGIWGNADVNIPAYPSNFSLDPDGFGGGVYAGYNWLLENDFLIGLEVAGNFISADDEGLSGGMGGEKYKVEQNWDAAILLRIGKVIDDTWMPYVTGGVAWTELETSYIPDGGWGSKKDTVNGWTIGAGVEMKLTTNIHARIEYRYTDYDTAQFVHAGPSNVDYNDNRVMVGISYRF
ncbi:outer membrane protein [Nitratifractor salsuginis]|uniref:Porin n=1 Tax=Nitratifractor salsuginis (strain DSM 16511 / JCM 12458 / E9I37-1) TaxID=749222 RepID=E6X0Z6_NITSE|nr:outer membrane protein [Nitratifractor salsuginis]ADV46928.1 porin [Nitratifractor salsuginis DSM 16511]